MKVKNNTATTLGCNISSIYMFLLLFLYLFVHLIIVVWLIVAVVEVGTVEVLYKNRTHTTQKDHQQI